MPTLPTFSISGAEVDADELYDSSIFDHSESTPDTLDILNGGLDSSNVASGQADHWSVQEGVLHRAYQYYWSRPDDIYAIQGESASSSSTERENRIIVPCLTHSVFVPWDASAAIVTWQALVGNVTSTDSDLAAGAQEEWWLDFYEEETRLVGLGTVIRASRFGASPAGQTPQESKARWLQRTIVLGSSAGFCQKGYRKLEVRARADVFDGDPGRMQLSFLSGSVNIQLFR